MCDPTTWEKTAQTPFHFSDRFVCTRGDEFFRDGEVCFDTPTPNFEIEACERFSGATEKKDGVFRTLFWSVVDHNGIVYGDCDQNVKTALRRVLALRKPPDWYLRLPEETDPDPTTPCMMRERAYYQRFDTEMRENQRTFIDEHPSLSEDMRSRYAPHFDEYLGYMEEALLHHADPHPKREMRVAGMQEILDYKNRVSLLTDTWLEKVTYKLKKDEIAKVNKYARMIGDLGVTASLKGFRNTAFMKAAQCDEPLLRNGITREFIKSPDPESLKGAFQKLLEPTDRGYFCYFSDDSCLSIIINGERHMFNMDISSCDASHTEALFYFHKSTYPVFFHDEIQSLIQQCRQTIRIYSDYDRKNFRCYLKPFEATLYSGSTLTTVINNSANSLIAEAISEGDFHGTHAEIEAQIIQAVARTGYVVTLQRCQDESDLQFLKHSPARDHAHNLEPVLNLGVLLRLSGTCRGDLPGKGCIIERAREFQHALLTGASSGHSHPLIDVMRANCRIEKPISDAVLLATKKILYDRYGESTTRIAITRDSIFRRYRLYDWEIDELLDDFARPGFCLHIANSACNKILLVDYGLKCN